MLARDTTYGDALFSPFLSIVVIIVVNQRTGNSTGFQSEEIGCNSKVLHPYETIHRMGVEIHRCRDTTIERSVIPRNKPDDRHLLFVNSRIQGYNGAKMTFIKCHSQEFSKRFYNNQA